MLAPDRLGFGGGGGRFLQGKIVSQQDTCVEKAPESRKNFKKWDLPVIKNEAEAALVARKTRPCTYT